MTFFELYATVTSTDHLIGPFWAPDFGWLSSSHQEWLFEYITLGTLMDISRTSGGLIHTTHRYDRNEHRKYLGRPEA